MKISPLGLKVSLLEEPYMIRNLHLKRLYTQLEKGFPNALNEDHSVP